MGEYKKITMADVSLPEYCYFFLKRILDDKSVKELTYDGETSVTIETSNEIHPYCYDAIMLICKTCFRKGLDVMIPTFRKEVTESGNIVIKYNWRVRRKINVDDLPF